MWPHATAGYCIEMHAWLKTLSDNLYKIITFYTHFLNKPYMLKRALNDRYMHMKCSKNVIFIKYPIKIA